LIISNKICNIFNEQSNIYKKFQNKSILSVTFSSIKMLY